MSGHHHRHSLGRRRALLVAVTLSAMACAERELDDGMAPEPPEHPPELLERYALACEDWCTLVDECGMTENYCNNCLVRDFSSERALCVEKAALRVECKAALTCEEVARLDSDSAQDRPCFGEGVAETAACYP